MTMKGSQAPGEMWSPQGGGKEGAARGAEDATGHPPEVKAIPQAIMAKNSTEGFVSE